MKVGQNIETERAGWTFYGNVAETFVDHVRQSVPMYDEGHDLTCWISDYFVHDDSVCYEIGASTGQLLRKLAEQHASKPNVRWIGIDPIPPMIEKAREHCAGIENIELFVGDAVTFEYERADLIVSYYCI